MNQPILGQTIDGKYSVRSLLGFGGLGAVYRAEQEELSRVVALKVLHGAVLSDQVSRARFEREARVLASLANEHIVGVYSFGMLANGHPYMAMEFLEGKTLAQTLAEEVRVPWPRLVNIGAQICRALQAAHKHGVIHRDLKPQNIMLLDQPEKDFVKVLDFGLSKLLLPGEEPTQKITQTGSIVGSIFYMSPELCAGMVADARSDVYSLGCILYECLTGRLPLESDHPFEMLHKHRTQLPPRFAAVMPAHDVPEQLERVIFKALQKDPKDRFKTMDEFLAALTLLAQGRATELTLTGIAICDVRKTGPGKIPKFAIWLSAIFLVLTGVTAAVLSVKQKQVHVQLSELKRLDEAHFRAGEILKAGGYARRAHECMEKGDLIHAEMEADKALRLIGRSFPKSALNSENAHADLEVMSSLAPVYARLPVGDASSKVYRNLGVMMRNDGEFLTSDEAAELTVLQALISYAHGYFPDSAHYFCSAAIMYIKNGQREKAEESVRRLQKLEFPKQFGSTVDFFVDLSKAYLALDRKDMAACELLAEKALADVRRTGIEGQGKFSFLIELFKLEQQLTDRRKAWRTLKELENILVSPNIRGCFEEQVLTRDIVGRNISAREIEDAVSMLRTLVAACQSAEMKNDAEGALTKLLELQKQYENKGSS